MDNIKTVVNDTKPRYVDSVEVPTSHPSHGVSMSEQAIAAIMSNGWPGTKVESVTPLGAGKSYNNKIYFLKMQHADKKAAFGEVDAVLKITARYTTAIKCKTKSLVYGCWNCIAQTSPFREFWRETKSLETLIPSDAKSKNDVGWILTAKVSGKVVNLEELDTKAITDLALQLADIVASWRLNIPAQKHCGSLKIREEVEQLANGLGDGVTPDRPFGPGISKMAVRGNVVEEIKLSTPIATVQEYYRLKLNNKLRQLESSDEFAPNRYLLSPLKLLVEERLPKLNFDEMFKQSAIPTDRFQFTHYDLFPRNILVTGSPPRITGIVDWEFSGFFPPVDEFLDDWLDGGDWPKDFYVVYLKRLEENGVATPAKSVRGDAWQMAWWLEKLIENAAP